MSFTLQLQKLWTSKSGTVLVQEILLVFILDISLAIVTAKYNIRRFTVKYHFAKMKQSLYDGIAFCRKIALNRYFVRNMDSDLKIKTSSLYSVTFNYIHTHILSSSFWQLYTFFIHNHDILETGWQIIGNFPCHLHLLNWRWTQKVPLICKFLLDYIASHPKGQQFVLTLV